MVNCSNCNKEMTRKVFCDNKCKMKYRNSGGEKDTISVKGEVLEKKIVTDSVGVEANVDTLVEKTRGFTNLGSKVISTPEEVVKVVPKRTNIPNRKIESNGMCRHFIYSSGYCPRCVEES